MIDFQRDTVASLASRVARRELSARDVVTHCISRIEALQPTINAFQSWDGEGALAQAAALDARIARGADVGPLAGIPIGVKDLEDAAGFRTTFGSPLMADAPIASTDSVLVARLRAAGCIVMGKTTTPEHGHKGVTDSPLFGATANPWARAFSPGGSSGGTGAAIAAGMIPLGTGSDGGGSIRIPSALCGLSGIKCSQGRVPVGGPKAPGSGVLTVKGPMARRIADVALALDAVIGPDPTDIFSHPAPLGSWRAALGDRAVPERVLWCPTMGFATVDASVLATCEAAVTKLAAAGSEVIPADSVFETDPNLAFIALWVVARYKAQGHLLGTEDWDRISPTIKAQIEYGLGVSGADYNRALDAAHEFNWQLEQAFSHNAPLILCPTAAGRAPRLGADVTGGTINGTETPNWLQLTSVFNLTRNPAGTVCAGLDANGLPVGLQVIGRQLDDVGVLQGIVALEDVIDFNAVADC